MLKFTVTAIALSLFRQTPAKVKMYCKRRTLLIEA